MTAFLYELRMLVASQLILWATNAMPKDDRHWPARKAAITSLSITMRT